MNINFLSDVSLCPSFTFHISLSRIRKQLSCVIFTRVIRTEKAFRLLFSALQVKRRLAIFRDTDLAYPWTSFTSNRWMDFWLKQKHKFTHENRFWESESVPWQPINQLRSWAIDPKYRIYPGKVYVARGQDFKFSRRHLWRWQRQPTRSYLPGSCHLQKIPSLQKRRPISRVHMTPLLVISWTSMLNHILQYHF